MRKHLTLLALLCGGLGSTGCQSTPVQQTLHLFGLARKPLVVALAADKPRQTTLTSLINPFEPCEPLLKAMSRRIDRPATWDLAFAFQVEGHLKLGLAQLALVSPKHYAEFENAQGFDVLAISRDEQGRLARPALLVVRKQSPIRRVEDLAHKVVAFGPPGDPRTHLAALLLLEAHGLTKGDLALEPLPVPGSLKHFTNMRAVAQSVIRGSSDAGFVDLREWETWPEHAESTHQPSRDRLRVLAETIRLPDYLVLRSPKLDDATTQQVRDFLLQADRLAPDALRSLDVAGFAPPRDDVLAACRRLRRVLRELTSRAPAGSLARAAR